MKNKIFLIMTFISAMCCNHSCIALGGLIKKVGSGIKKTAKDVGRAVEKGGKAVVKETERVGKKILQCADAARIAAQEAAKEGAYRTANTTLEGAKGTVTLAQKTLDAANATQQGLLKAANEAQSLAIKASDAVQIAGMEAAKGTLAVAAKLTDLTAEAIAQGFNIKKVHFEASFADLASGVLPKATIEGTVFGQSFNLKVNADFTDIESLAEKIINRVFG